MTAATTPSFAVFGRLIDDGRDLGEGIVVVEDGKIATVRSDELPQASASLPELRFRVPIISPGFVDLQVNGAFGFEVDTDAAALRALAGRLPETGVTAFLPTLVSRRESAYAPAFAAFAAAATAGDGGVQAPLRGAATLLGMHLEGPLLSERRAGAHDRAAIAAASPEAVGRILAAAAQAAVRIRVLTLAPERDGALSLIPALEAAGTRVSLGHTDASFELARAAIDAGARLATHVFNAMPPMHHRNPGTAGAVLSDDRVTVLFIADGIHVHPAMLELAMRAKPPRRRAIVTDAISGAGLPAGPEAQQARSGQGALAGQTLHIDATSARLADGTLAGSTLMLDAAVRNCVALAGVSVPEALRMATAVPAAAIDATSHGRLTVGNAADLVLLDGGLHVLATFIGGDVAFVRGGNVDAFRA
jgi:N-acetylglucosamine-6-phosphate deacetylase